MQFCKELFQWQVTQYNKGNCRTIKWFAFFWFNPYSLAKKSTRINVDYLCLQTRISLIISSLSDKHAQIDESCKFVYGSPLRNKNVLRYSKKFIDANIKSRWKWVREYTLRSLVIFYRIFAQKPMMMLCGCIIC